MKAQKFRGIRTAVAASGAALLMLVAGCSGSEDADADQGSTTDQSAGAENTEDSGAAEDTDTPEPSDEVESGSAEETSGAEESEEDSQSEEDSEESENSASGAVAPAEDFDPCEALSPEDVSGVVGFDVGDPESQEMAGGTICTFPPTGSDVQTAMVQWAPVEGPLETMADCAKGMFDEASDPEEITIEGASDGLAFNGKYQSVAAAAVYSAVDGGVTQVIVAGDGADVDTAVELTELTLSKA